MRMRRKKNLEARLEACGDYILYLDRDEKNFQDKSNKQLIDFEKIFGNSNPLVLEIGCGKGQFAREIAKRNPDKNFLAVEKSSNVIVDAAQMAIDEGILNIWIALSPKSQWSVSILTLAVRILKIHMHVIGSHTELFLKYTDVFLWTRARYTKRPTICTSLSSPWRSSLRQITDLKTFLSTFTTAASRAIS